MRKNDTEVLDRIDWHLDSARAIYSSCYGEESIAQIDIRTKAGTHIAYFYAWLIINDCISFSEYDISEDIQTIKEKKGSPMQLLLDRFDEELSVNLISTKVREFVTVYYNDYFYDDYELFLKEFDDGLFLCEFDWSKYYVIERLIDNKYVGWMSNKLL